MISSSSSPVVTSASTLSCQSTAACRIASTVPHANLALALIRAPSCALCLLRPARPRPSPGKPAFDVLHHGRLHRNLRSWVVSFLPPPLPTFPASAPAPPATPLLSRRRPHPVKLHSGNTT